ncbi:uncharacterized protein N0V89_012539 [Didymosphaeria variabile]|uniref:Rab-GAP TBC domain-containing protein n=1 Tax=Didymosphaeria variabile TaxID=1932322 RepID=A0A9W8XA43_9PLEO|nr:uncharacterized protein N0V89_012539 [Didymosphaeria variabile]KAJ4344795.1 hypothetical protein N0V89_012539 [Didymosphaeria variabile]
MPTALFAAQQHHAFGAGTPFDPDVHYIHSHPDKNLYIITESDYVSALIPSQRTVCAKQAPTRYLGPSRRIALQHHDHNGRKDPRPLMAAVLQRASTMPLAAPGSPPDLTNSKSSKSSSFHSEGLSDMGPSDLSHFEDINLADDTGPANFPVPHSPNRILFDGSRSRSIPHAAPHSFRDLTKGSKPRPAAMKIQTSHNLRAGSQLHAPGKQLRRGFSSPSAPSLANITNLQAPVRRSRSPSPNKPLPSSSSSQRTLSRKSSRNLEVSPSMTTRRQSWQHAARKSAKEREAECDDEDDELPEDAVIWNVPISPRPVQERSPAPSSCGSPPQTSPSPAASRPVSQRGDASSMKTSPAFSERRVPSQPPTPDPSKENEPPALTRQPTNTWEETYGTLDADARKLTEALEEYQTEIEHQQEVKRQQPLSRSSSVGDHESKKKKAVPLPPVRKSDPLIDPFQPSIEKEKYLSRTRPSWLPPKDPKEEKKHLKEYQKMLARIEEAERLEAKRQEDEAIAREKAERIKAEYWSSLLLPNWAQEMANAELKGSHRKMWWNGVPAKLRGEVWKKAIGNELEVSEATYNVALEKAQLQVQELGSSALEGRYARIVESTKSVFADLKMFAPETQDSPEQPLHQELVNICIAYSSYRPDVDTTVGIHHMAALFLLNLSASDSFIALSNLMNRALPLSFLIQDQNAITAAYDTTLSALAKKCPSMAHRLAELRVEPRDYLFEMFSGLFCDRVSIEHAARIMDVYTIEGDKIPARVAVALMGALEGSCMSGEAGDVVEVLRSKKLRESPDEFMGKVYEAGKSS